MKGIYKLCPHLARVVPWIGLQARLISPIFLLVRINELSDMETAKITTKGQTTIPAPIRKAIHLEAGDLLAFEVEGDHLIVRKIGSPDDAYLRGIEGTLDEWSSPEDEEAWSAL